mmetsp:Transcript_49078/g.87550  ORF Transcript_49078/g.87550 Transcript_49078/m.87550 type:complete len:284 (-) Transcript_49078:6808-7659(-)
MNLMHLRCQLPFARGIRDIDGATLLEGLGHCVFGQPVVLHAGTGNDLRPSVIVKDIAVKEDTICVLRQVPRGINSFKVNECPRDRLGELRNPLQQPIVHVLQTRDIHKACLVFCERLNDLFVQWRQVRNGLVVLQVNLGHKRHACLQGLQHPTLLRDHVNTIFVTGTNAEAVGKEHAGIVDVPDVLEKIIHHLSDGVGGGKGIQRCNYIQIRDFVVVDGLDVRIPKPHLVQDVGLERIGQTTDQELDQPLLCGPLLPSLKHPLSLAVRQCGHREEEAEVLPLV